MSDLTTFEKLKIEKLLDMGGGYVLDFSNRTFREFILENTNLDIYDEKYNYWSGSKANRLRAFWDKESNFIVGKLIAYLLEYWKTKKLTSNTEIKPTEQTLFEECFKIAERLKQESPVENIEIIDSISDEKDFSLLAKSIRESIYKNEPEVALDRLHTFITKYIKSLCKRHNIEIDKDKPLHSLFGEYIKYLKNNKLIDSQMTERILKTSISVMEAFNDVRNNQSFAHDNPLLNYRESLLIFNNVTNTIKFIESMEHNRNKKDSNTEEEYNDLPF